MNLALLVHLFRNPFAVFRLALYGHYVTNRQQVMKHPHALTLVSVLIGTMLFNFATQAQVQFFSDPNYRGQSARFEAASFNSLGLGLDGKVSSVRIPAGYAVIVYDQMGLQGNSQKLTASVPAFNRWNDRIRSVRVFGRTVPGPVPVSPPGHVQLFDGQRYSGSSRSLPAGSYPILVLYDRRISALQIPRGYSVLVFDQPNFRGNQLRLSESTPSMANFRWDNRVRSMQIIRAVN